MSLLRSAATRLAQVRRPSDLDAVAALLGFGDFEPLDARAASSLGLSDAVRRAAVARGAGTLRVLRFACDPHAPPRDTVARASAHLSTRSPELLWLVLALHEPTGTVVVAAPAPGGGTRVAALTTETARVTDSDAETLAAMAGASQGVDVLVHQRWRELLGRDALTRRFYRELERVVGDLASTAHGDARDAARRDIALLHASRLLFLSFLEAKGWLDGDRDFLRHRFDARCLDGGGVHRRLLDPLFFGTLNTPVSRRAPVARALGRVPFLNGGLFARTSVERRNRSLRLTDDAIGALIIGVLGRFRVTAREHSTAWHEAAVDPEMLGRAFESLMASPERRATGAFYTPPELIERVTTAGLESALAPQGVSPTLLQDAMRGVRLRAADRATIRRALDQFRVLDPACGSGAFLVHVLERLSQLARAAGDTRPVSELRRDILARSVFGVDVNPTAVWLCELRLWLSVVIDAPDDDPMRVAPLPNLDRHVRVGDALAGDAFGAPVTRSASGEVARLRSRYVRATGASKRSLARTLDRAERTLAVQAATHACERAARRRCDLLAALRSRDLFARRVRPTAAQERQLESLRADARDARRRLAALRAGGSLPFAFAAHFADAAARDGFDLVLGNPPWVRLHHIPPASRETFRRTYRAFRDAAWCAAPKIAGASHGFSAQADLAALFVERSLALTRPNGSIALLVPAKLWRSLSGGGVRRVVLCDANVVRLDDWSESQAAFDAVVYPSLLVARRRAAESTPHATPHATRHVTPATPTIDATLHRREQTLAWTMPARMLTLDASDGAPWMFLPPEARVAFDRLVTAGTPLADSAFGRPLLGVKTGCNEPFLVPRDAPAFEAASLRPVLRGEQVRPWRSEPGTDAILWTHGTDGAPLRALPRAVSDHLTPWRRRLAALRTDDAPLTLATAHGTKGLEWDHVLVLADGFPGRRSITDAAEPERALEEERRLAYVAWTRARRSLTLLYDPAAPTRFLTEAFDPAELVPDAGAGAA